MDDLELRRCLERIRQGDRQAFAALYTDLQTPVFTVILRIVQNRAEAEDVMQDLFLKLYQNPPGPELRKPRAYLFQSARNLALDSLKKRRPTLELDRSPHLPAGSPAFDLAEKLDLERTLAQLDPMERQIIALHLNGGLTFRQIAAMVQLPLGTVLWRYHRALDRLRARLSD